MRKKDANGMVKIHKNIMWREVEGEIVALNADNSNYYTLNATGARIWKLIDAGHSIDAIVQDLHTSFDIALPTAAKHVDKLVKELAREKLISAG